MSENFNTGLIILDENGIISSANSYISKLINIHPSDMVGKKLSEFYITEESSLVHREGHFVPVYVETQHFSNGVTSFTILVLWNEQMEIQNDSTYKLITENTTDLICLLTAEGIIRYASPSHRTILGYDPADLIGKTTFEFVHPDDKQGALESFEKMKKYQTPSELKFRFRHIDGRWIHVESKSMPIANEKGELKDIVAVIRDVSEQFKTLRKIEESEQRYKSLFEQNPDMVFALDMEFCFVSINPSMVEKSKYQLDELMNRPFSTLIAPTELKKTITKLTQTKKGQPQTYESIMIDKNGKRIEVNIIAIPIVTNGDVVGIYGISKDMTQQRQAERTIHRLAYYDSLTGLPNRFYFNSHLSQILTKAKTENKKFALMFFDMDNFKNINDSLGHSAGDLLLKQLANRLLEVLPKKGTFLSRISGDEFTIIIEEFQDIGEITELAGSIVDSFQKAFVLEQQEIVVTSSIGITLFPEHGDDRDTLIKNADTAMYRAKDKGKNHYTYFAPHMGQKPIKQLTMEMNLRKAIENKEFEMYYQPIIDAYTEKLVSMEALIRWNHPELGMISPGEFIPLAEITGIINPLGDWILKEVIRQAKAWQTAGYRKFPVSVNISGKQFERKDVFKLVNESLKEADLEPKWLTLEITETVAMQHKNNVLHTLKTLKELGCNVAIDDFGSGYSSLTYLRNFPTDYLKMDRGFVKGMLASDKNSAIIKTIIELGHILDLKVIAEGVENQSEFNVLKQYRCDQIQGYLFGKPMPSEEIERLFLKKESDDNE